MKNTTTTTMDIPNDVIMAILSRLPVKSLLRFKWVCKSWFNLIRDPSFVSMQLNYNINHKLNNNPLVLICSSNEYQHKLKLNSYNIMDTNDDDHALLCPNSLVSVLKVPSATTLRYPIKILGSCNGLLCIMGIRSSTSVCETYFICNPCTKEYKKVDHVDRVMANNGTCVSSEYGLGRRYGFGYGCTIDDYKLVKTAIRVLDNGDRETCIYVYTLGTSAWKTTRSSYQFMLYSTGTPEADDANGVVLSGHFYYTAKKKSPVRVDIIVSFDFAKEEYRQIPIPVICEDGFYLKLGELKGCLCLFSCSTTVGSRDIAEVWMMRHNVENNIDVKEDYTWETLCTIKSANVRWNSLSPKTPKLLRICKNGEILMVTVDANTFWKEIVLYDPKSGKITSLRKVSRVEEVENFMESLVSLNSGTYMM